MSEVNKVISCDFYLWCLQYEVSVCHYVHG